MANIDGLLKELEKKYGLGSVMKLTDEPKEIERISSGSINFDIALGGGLPKGRMAEYYGAESTGKTTMATLAMIEYQKAMPDKAVAFIDVEHSYNQKYAQDMGLDLENMVFTQPDSAEQAMDIAEALARSGEISLIVLDSVSALLPKYEEEEDFEKQTIGLQARLLSKALRKLTPVIAKSNTTMIWINQLREKMTMYGDPTTTSGKF